MSKEYFPGGAVYEESILTVDEFGEEIYVPISQIPELKPDVYNWSDAMTVTFDEKGESND